MAFRPVGTASMNVREAATVTSTRESITIHNADEARAAANAAAASEFYNLHEIVRKARANLNQNDWDYIVGGTETETTLRRNRMALDSIALRPRGGTAVSIRRPWTTEPDREIQAWARLLRDDQLPAKVAYDLRRLARDYEAWSDPGSRGS